MAAEGGQMTHILVTNDFPPKLGGIQSYLWELWRRLPPDRFAVLTTPYAGDAAFDAAQAFRVERTRQRVLFPTRAIATRVNALVGDTKASLAVLDPALPLGAVGRRLDVPYAVVLHGAEVSVPGRLPGSHSLLARVLRGASHVVAAGAWVAGQAEGVVDRARRERLVRRSSAPVRLLGRVDDERLPSLYGCADAFAMLCRNRWGGLEQEGFGIVFLEAAACGVPQVAGDSGGASEAVVDGETGLVVRRPGDGAAVAAALSRLVDDAQLRRAQGRAARARAEAEFAYGVL